VTSLRESLLAALATSREMESPLLDVCDDSPSAQPATWSAKDHLAHISRYREYGAIVLDAVRRGTPPPPDAEADLDERNARLLAENRSLTAIDVRDRAAASYERLVRAVARCPDEILRGPRSAGSEAPLWWLVSGCGWGHVGQHLVHWHRDRNDWRAAEQAARRVHEIEMSSFDDTRQRATATYNLGCFYATSGRRDEAVALIEQALAQASELREAAQGDPDLESIRPILGLDAV